MSYELEKIRELIKVLEKIQETHESIAEFEKKVSQNEKV